MDELKKIVSLFINKEVDQITEGTLIDKTVINGSILIHRMYSTIANNGFIIKDYTKIKTYGELLESLKIQRIEPIPKLSKNKKEIYSLSENKHNNIIIRGIGIDIERISNLPVVADFRTDAFYIQNFTKSEISYCILKENPLESFAGLFCVKEAVFKTGVEFKDGVSFNQIEISHSLIGAPILDGYQISISHADGFVVAVAIAINFKNTL